MLDVPALIDRKSRERFIKQQQLGFLRERHRDLDASLFSVGHFADRSRGALIEADQAEHPAPLFDETGLKGERTEGVPAHARQPKQRQHDVWGALLDSVYLHAKNADHLDGRIWPILSKQINAALKYWREPDAGIWEVRGGRQQFTHSKMMAWLAFDRAIKLVENCGCAAYEHFDRWQKIRDQIHAEVCERGYNPKKKAFTQVYGSDALDASLLTMPLTGFLPVTDERVRGTIEAIERELMHDGFVLRYRPQETGVDGLPGNEGVFLPCSFWLADCWHLLGRKKEARELFERLLDVRNDLGLLSEEYDPRAKRQLGNFPQAFSHVALVSCARILGDEDMLLARRD